MNRRDSKLHQKASQQHLKKYSSSKSSLIVLVIICAIFIFHVTKPVSVLHVGGNFSSVLDYGKKKNAYIKKNTLDCKNALKKLPPRKGYISYFLHFSKSKKAVV